MQALSTHYEAFSRDRLSIVALPRTSTASTTTTISTVASTIASTVHANCVINKKSLKLGVRPAWKNIIFSSKGVFGGSC